MTSTTFESDVAVVISDAFVQHLMKELSGGRDGISFWTFILDLESLYSNCLGCTLFKHCQLIYRTVLHCGQVPITLMLGFSLWVQ